jgi:hypothetical protein
MQHNIKGTKNCCFFSLLKVLKVSIFCYFSSNIWVFKVQILILASKVQILIEGSKCLNHLMSESHLKSGRGVKGSRSHLIILKVEKSRGLIKCLTCLQDDASSKYLNSGKMIYYLSICKLSNTSK